MKRLILSLLLILFSSCGSKTGESGGYNVTTLVGSGTAANIDGLGTAASISAPDGVTFANDGKLYMTDAGNHAIKVVTSDGQITTLAGDGTSGTSDGAGAAAHFNTPDGIATDSQGNIYVADTGNNEIRKIDTANNVTTVAGTTVAGSNNGVGAGASFNAPAGIVVDDSTGEIYVADEKNNSIRKIATDGTVTTVVGGSGAGDLDGVGTGAKLNAPHGLTIDPEGNLYVSDTKNHKIKKIHKNGRYVETIAGSTAGDNDDQRYQAQLNSPHGVAFDRISGNLFIADEKNQKIKTIELTGTRTGRVTTIAGSGQTAHALGRGYNASFNKPRGMAVDDRGNVYTCDSVNNRIKKLTR